MKYDPPVYTPEQVYEIFEMSRQQLPSGSLDPVFGVSRSWFFWDETWSDYNGPYQSEAHARAALVKYCEECL